MAEWGAKYFSSGSILSLDVNIPLQVQYHQHVTQPLLLEQIHDLGIDISSGKLSDFLTEALDRFHAEKDEFLKTGAIEYMAQNKLPIAILTTLENTSVRIHSASSWCEWMDQQSIYQAPSQKDSHGRCFNGRVVGSRYSL